MQRTAFRDHEAGKQPISSLGCACGRVGPTNRARQLDLGIQGASWSACLLPPARRPFFFPLTEGLFAGCGNKTDILNFTAPPVAQSACFQRNV